MANFGLIGTPTQINVTAGPLDFESAWVQSGAGWIFYVPTTSFGLSGLTGNLIAREISSAGAPTGSEVDLAIPAAQSGFMIEGAQSAVLTDGSFIVSYEEYNSSTLSSNFSDVVHYSSTGTLLGSFTVNAFALPATALAGGGFVLTELGVGGTASPNAILATYAETGTTPMSTSTIATATAGQEIVAAQTVTSAGTVNAEDIIAQAAGQTSGIDITLPGIAAPLVFSAPAANSATTSYYLFPSKILAASDGSFYQAITTTTNNVNANTSSAQINLYHYVSGAAQLLTTINESLSSSATLATGNSSIALLSNGDIALEYGGALQTTGVTGYQQYVDLFSSTGTQIGSTLSLGVGVGGLASLTPLSNGNLASVVETSSGLFLQQLGFGAPSTTPAADDFTGNGTSDILLQNGAGTMVDWIVSNGAITAGNNLGTNLGWNPVGTGGFNGDGTSDILMQNGSGTIVDWTMLNGTVSNAAVIGNAVGFNVVGTGDFTGNGTDDILLQNSAGTIVDWIVKNGAITAGNNLGTNPGWNVVGTGDFNGDGTTDVLLENSSTKTVVDWTMGNGTVASAAVIGNAGSYNLVGTGDFTGNGTADILLQNAGGDLVDWIMSNGAITSAHDLGVNPGWTVAATGDYTGNGVSDILLTNAAGNVVDWTMSNGVVSNGALIGNSVGFTVKH